MSIVKLETELQEAERDLARRRAMWEASRAACEPLVEDLEKIKGIEISLSHDLDLRFIGGKEKLLAVLRVLSKHGWRFRYLSDRPQPGKPGWSGYLDREGCIAVWLSFSSSVCKRIPVGKRMVEEVIYETVCDEDPRAEREAGHPEIEREAGQTGETT